jgi:xanthine dehydrogenase small subunit
MRDSICFSINGQSHEVKGDKVFMTLSDYLRYDQNMPGTKVVCAEGDCGACTVLVGSVRDLNSGKIKYRSINSCISFLYTLDLHSIVTIEGIEDSELHPVQESMRENHGAQCGYCTPGFICAMAGMTDTLIRENKKIETKRSMNYLTGNLCRCTGYEPIIKACEGIDLKKVNPLYERYHDQQLIDKFTELSKQDVRISTQIRELRLPATEEGALKIKSAEVRITSGATDLGVLVNKGKLEQQKVACFNNVSDFYKIEKIGREYHVGAKVTWTALEEAIEKDLTEYADMIKIFASPQIKNQGTLIGNIANASPIADGIPYLMVNDSRLILASKNGEREVETKNFFKGYKQLDLQSDEIIKKVILPIPGKDVWTKLYKVSLRRDMDISAVTFAGTISVVKDKINSVQLALGGVGPIVLRLPKTEAALIGRVFSREEFFKARDILITEITPISDIRGSREFRLQVAKNLLMKFHDELAKEKLSQEVEVNL